MDGVTEWTKFRNYEVSVWTLQDNYITTLKSGDPILVASQPAVVWPQARAQGQIQNGKMTLNVDGTQQFSFDIPMYIYVNGEKIENPNWYNTINENILVSLRKIKVIFNKWQNTTIEERSNSTFEFIILKISETHEKDNLICHVECEGLAFHELGKVGYKRSLTTDGLNNDYYKWSLTNDSDYIAPDTKEAHKPEATLQYWMEGTVDNDDNSAKIKSVPRDGNGNILYDELNPNIWYYEIRMAHTSLVHNITVYDTKIYEESVPIDWTSTGAPARYMQIREMARLVDINESNLYNITQDLAEKFGVFCRYQYIYDNNYNIVGRVIVFYNNFLQEGKDVESLMYPNSASKIVRTMDSTDVSTKMFVRSVEQDDLYTGTINIMDCSANKSQEDYILNFDYLHEIGTISDEQYEAINTYENTMRILNLKMVPLQDALSNLTELKASIDAKVTYLTNSIEQDEERITENQAIIYALDTQDGDNDGFITRDYKNPAVLNLMKDSSNADYDSYYVQFNRTDANSGIQPDTLELYKDYDTTATSIQEYGVGFTAWNESTWFQNNGELVIPNSWETTKLVYQTTYGNSSAGIVNLPSATSENKGWIYRHISSGNLAISNGSSWITYSAPNNSIKKGFFIFTRTRTYQMNGLVTEVGKCTRKACEDTNVDYVTSISRLYYTTSSNTAPAAPTIDGTTEISKNLVLEKWCTGLTTPNTNISNYNYYYVWQFNYAFASTKFSYVHKITTDITGTNIATAVANAKSIYLKPANKIEGTYVYDEYGNLDKVTGLFVRAKGGDYYYYGARGVLNITDTITNENINSITSSLFNTATQKNYPSNIKDQYAIIKIATHHNNGNITYSYNLKYFNSTGVMTTPSGTINNIVSRIQPIFYLKTNNTSVPLPTAAQSLTVVNNAVNNAWTTILPDKTESSWTYYSGWKVISYGSTVKYYVPQSNGAAIADTSLKKKVNEITTNNDDDIPKYIYAIYKYKPDWYYENIKNAWISKLDQDNTDIQTYMDRKNALDDIIEVLKESIEDCHNEKEKEIAKFEHMMGAALRESYWQPEDEYQDYGSKYDEILTLPKTGLSTNLNSATFFNNSGDGQLASIGWDATHFDEEDKLYYAVGVNQTKVYYPCIDLTAITPQSGSTSFFNQYISLTEEEKSANPFSFFFNPVTETIPDGGNSNDIRYCQYYTIGSTAKFAFIRSGSSIKPVLLLTGSTNLSSGELQNLYKNGCIGRLFTEKKDNNMILVMKPETTFTIPDAAWLNVKKENGNWIDNSNITSCEIVYPRILIPSLKLKTNSKDLIVKFNDEILTEYTDYQVLTKTYYNSNTTTSGNITKSYYLDVENVNINETNAVKATKFVNYYTITIKPEFLFEHINVSTGSFEFTIYYIISNADLDIYLDAKQIAKENAYPKVEYEIEVSKWSPELLTNLYSKLAQLVMINDTDLKLQNTFGYISQVELDLDHEEKDQIEIKNYKTKFEDLFSKIVAETEEMHKNSRNIGLAGALASGDSVAVTLDSEGFSNTLADATNQEILQQFLNEYFDGPEIVQQKLKELFDEAGSILGSAADSLNSVLGATTKNATILAGFRENVAAALTPKVFTGKTQPTDFKPGDVWINEEDGYRSVATGYSGKGGGFTRTYDGSLAEITGASLNINADDGTVDILGETQINLMSGKNIYIAAGDTVDIVGNKAVNIGGTTINMASSIITGAYPSNTGEGGIHLVSTSYTYTPYTAPVEAGTGNEGDAGSLTLTGTSRVDIHGEGIELASKNGITIKSDAGIKIYSASDESAAAIRLDRNDGIYIGSDKPLKLFSGKVKVLADGSIDTNDPENSGANVELSAERLLLGVGNLSSSSATAIELTEEQIILAAGSSISTYLNGDGTVNLDKITAEGVTIAGVQIKSNYIGMATGSGTAGNPRSMFALQPGEIRLGQMTKKTANSAGTVPDEYTGNFIWLANNEMYFGNSGSLTLNTDNIKIQTKLLTPPSSSNNSAYATTDATAQVAVAQMGFVLGKDLNNSTAAKRKPYFGYWVDQSGKGHLVVDADIIRLGHDGVVDNLSLSETMPTEVVRLYTLHNSNVTAPLEPTGYGVNWGNYTTVNLTTKSWTINLPAAPNSVETVSGNMTYIWSIIQYTYKINGITKYKTSASPMYEGILDNISQKSYKQYKYYSSAPTESDALSNSDTGWSIAIPDRTKATTYYYGTNVCTKGTNITSNININDSDGSNYNIRQNTSSDAVTVTVTDTSSQIRTISVPKGGWIIKVKNIWILTTNLTQKANNNVLYSRIHVVKNNGNSFNKDLQQEVELAELSQAAIEAMNIASGAFPVSSVLSSGLTIDGNNVVLGSTGKLMLLGNSEVFIGTSSSNSAVLLNKNGISIGTGGNIGIVSSGSKGIDIKVIDNNTEKAGITMNKDDGFKVTSNVAINMNSTNFIVNSKATGTDAIFYVGASGKSIKYSATNGLEIEGKVTATSFTLSPSATYTETTVWYVDATKSTPFTTSSDNVTWLTNMPSITTNAGKYLHSKTTTSLGGRQLVNYNVTYLPKDGEDGQNGQDGQSYSIEGMNPIGWGSGTTTKARYVAITSTGGLLLGANNGIVIPRVTPVQLDANTSNDNTADNTDTILEINQQHINLDYYSGTTKTSYIHMNSEGLQVNGKRISINNSDVWARDDIIVMKNTVPSNAKWQDSVNHIEQYMNNQSITIGGTTYQRGSVAHDWVLIKPYYSSQIDYAPSIGAIRLAIDSHSFTMKQTSAEGGNIAFGDGANWYKYKIQGTFTNSHTVAFGGTLDFYFSTEQSMDSNNYQSVANKVTMSWNSPGVGPNYSSSFTIETTETDSNSQINLCKEDTPLYCYVFGFQEPSTLTFELYCYCDATTSKVPCTVYYYP